MASEVRLKGLQVRQRWDALHAYDRNVFILLLYTLGKGLQLTIGAVTINLYALSLGFHSDFIGVLTGMPAIGAFIAGVPAGLLADRFGRRPLILVSAVMTPITLIAIALSNSGPLLLTASFLNGLLASAYWITNLPMLTESTTNAQRVGVLAMNSFLLLGVGALGSFIGGQVPEVVGHITHQAATSVLPMRWGVLAAAIVAAVPALPLVLLREPPRPTRKGATAVGAVPITAVATTAAVGPATTTAMPPLASRFGRWSMVALFVMLLVPDVLFTTGESSVIGLEQVFFRLRFSLQPGTLGTILLLTGLVGGAMALIAPRLVRRWGKLRLVTSVQFLSVPVVLGIGFAPVVPLAVLAELLRSMLRGLFEPIYATFAMESVPASRRATLSGFYGLTWGVGYSVGASVAGFLQLHIGLSAPFVVGAICLTLAPSLLLFFFSNIAWRAKMSPII